MSQKITLATVKSFLKREAKNNNLYLKVNSRFDAMTDGVMQENGVFEKQDAEKLNLENKSTFGFPGLWFVGSSRDYFEPFADDNFIGYIISNCCGMSTVAMKRLY